VILSVTLLSVVLSSVTLSFAISASASSLLFTGPSTESVFGNNGVDELDEELDEELDVLAG
jgi:hypothetical protein